jgi:hypothetical protein
MQKINPNAFAAFLAGYCVSECIDKYYALKLL